MQREQPEDQDAAWKAIVDNYGDPVLEPGDDAAPAEEEPRPGTWELGELDDQDDDPDAGLLDDPEDHFVPPVPPPVPKPPLDRLLAWLGVFGAPALLLFFVITGIAIPKPIGWLLVGSFVAGFCYLVVRMPATPRDPWDNGAQL